MNTTSFISLVWLPAWGFCLLEWPAFLWWIWLTGFPYWNTIDVRSWFALHYAGVVSSHMVKTITWKTWYHSFTLHMDVHWTLKVVYYACWASLVWAGGVPYKEPITSEHHTHTLGGCCPTMILLTPAALDRQTWSLSWLAPVQSLANTCMCFSAAPACFSKK